MEKDTQRTYLTRLGLEEPASPTLNYLKELHRAHVTRIPWETVDIFAGKPMPIGVAQSVRLLTEGRSGYCFHLNGASGQEGESRAVSEKAKVLLVRRRLQARRGGSLRRG
ncbi:arylamine N-acetyltransferase [Cohnella sp. REN36]|uniref:arylamine N-acetyltransferase n=1 Tax=Cohnella sp. REN36 TaxID=2887347 RepID=UPI001D150AD3|nr:arylamine N-acetyltransferase [Cohnella sp. REN36]MCC3375182.1 arylamine N-acetyltransferase [Cohnella sp. REN36]